MKQTIKYEHIFTFYCKLIIGIILVYPPLSDLKYMPIGDLDAKIIFGLIVFSFSLLGFSEKPPVIYSNLPNTKERGGERSVGELNLIK